MPKMTRIHHPHHLWEEVEFNMWGSIPKEKREEAIKEMIRFTSDADAFGKEMLNVVKDWKYSCEHNLSDTSQNRRAWIGQSACALAFQYPEDVVRSAWSNLTPKQQAAANAAADRAILKWEEAHLKQGSSMELPL